MDNAGDLNLPAWITEWVDSVVEGNAPPQRASAATNATNAKHCGSAESVPHDEFENTEKRKEKSRDAARCRRSREMEIFSDLSDALPLPASAVAHLDKASVMRLAICYLKVRSLIHMVPEQVTPKCEVASDPLAMSAMEGFLLVLSADGDMVFLSENVQDYLGVNQLEMMGHSIYEFSHPCDHDEIKEILSEKSVANGDQRSVVPRSSFLRMKCTLTSKGRNVNLKSASYKVIHYTGHMLTGPTVPRAVCHDSDSEGGSTDGAPGCGGCELVPQKCLVAIGEPIPHPSNIEIPLDKQTFLSKHSLDMKFTYADDKIGEFLGYDPAELVGKSMYEFHHAMDSAVVEKGFKCLFSKGQCQTGRFRFLACGGGYVWVVTQATLLYASKGEAKGHKPQSVVCVHFVTSGIEERDEIFASSQLSCVPAAVQAAPSAAPVPAQAAKAVGVPAAEPKAAAKAAAKAEAPAAPSAPRVQSVTATLFKSVPAEPQVAVPAVPEVVVLPPASPTPPLPPPPSVDISVNQYIRPDIFSLSPTFSSSLSPALSPALSDGPLLRPTSATSSIFAASPAPSSPTPSSSTPSSPSVYLRPQAATASIFAPRTEDMNKGFLMFSEDEGLTMLKDEPEDLTHLAPTAGDVCVPLEGPYLGDMFEDFMLSDSDNYCPLLGDVGDDNSNSKFFLYRDSDSDPSPGELSPSRHSRLLLSPTLSPTLSSALSESPGECSLPSLCSPSRAVDLDDNMTSFMSLSVDTGMTSLSDTDDDLSLRAPYIPMGEDLPLIMSNDLMWGSSLPYKSSCSSSRSSTSGSSSSRSPDDSGGGDNSNSGASSPFDSSHSCWSPQPQTSSKPDMNSSLARLLQSNTSSHNNQRQSASDLVDPCEVLGQIYSKKQSSAWSGARGAGRPVAGASYAHKRGASGLGQYIGAKRGRLNVAVNRSKKARSDVHTSDSVLVLDGARAEHKPVPLPQPSDSVLMNLLGQDGMFKIPIQKKDAVVALGNLVASASSILRELAGDKIPDDAPIVLQPAKPPESGSSSNTSFRPVPMGRELLRKNSFSLLDPDGMIPSLADLSQQDYDVNAPVSSQGSLLQGEELLTALEMSGAGNILSMG
ncbi:hypoxia-inducible factor 1-alpha-like [Thrips palmi]|uniref:Hypoxia-inducible factor 1-alpha-like n=1 Tax=Thrips palmi TaxID=161013 RepID=A0A6P8ZWU9_THRPL|nr:hypoxia-inducible factor 1-alpha-like [Thrips palmi]